MILYLQQFVYQKINSCSSILKQVNSVFYQVPANGNFPYIYIGDFYSKNISTKNKEIFNINFKVILYLRDKSLKSMLKVAREIKDILKINNEEKIILMHCCEEKIINQNDGITQQIIMSFKATVVEECCIAVH